MVRSDQSLRILVVDDLEDTARSLAFLLAQMGHEVQWLTDPFSVPDTVDRFKPQIALLDIGMPGMDGWTLAVALRRKYPPDTLHLVALTAYGEREDRMRSRQAGFDAHLCKPAGVALLESTIKTFYPF